MKFWLFSTLPIWNNVPFERKDGSLNRLQPPAKPVGVLAQKGGLRVSSFIIICCWIFGVQTVYGGLLREAHANREEYKSKEQFCE